MVSFLLTLIVVVSVSQINDTMTLMMLQAKCKNNINFTIEKKKNNINKSKINMFFKFALQIH